MTKGSPAALGQDSVGGAAPEDMADLPKPAIFQITASQALTCRDAPQFPDFPAYSPGSKAPHHDMPGEQIILIAVGAALPGEVVPVFRGRVQASLM